MHDDKLAGVLDDIEVANTLLQNLSNRENDLAKELEQLSIGDKDPQIIRLEKKLEEDKQRVTALENEISSYYDDIQDAEARRDESENELAKSQAELERVEFELAKFAEQIQLNDKYNEMVEHLQTLEKTLYTKQVRLQNRTRTVDQKQEQISKSVSDDMLHFVDLSQELERAREENEELMSAKDALHDDIRSLLNMRDFGDATGAFARQIVLAELEALEEDQEEEEIADDSTRDIELSLLQQSLADLAEIKKERITALSNELAELTDINYISMLRQEKKKLEKGYFENL